MHTRNRSGDPKIKANQGCLPYQWAYVAVVSRVDRCTGFPSCSEIWSELSASLLSFMWTSCKLKRGAITHAHVAMSCHESKTMTKNGLCSNGTYSLRAVEMYKKPWDLSQSFIKRLNWGNRSTLHGFWMMSFNLQSNDSITDDFWRENENHTARLRKHSWIILIHRCTGVVARLTVTRAE